VAQSEHSPLTLKNCRSDFAAVAATFGGADGEPMEPAEITSANLRQFERTTGATCCVAAIPYAEYLAAK
jgi:hypothetical protein